MSRHPINVQFSMESLGRIQLYVSHNRTREFINFKIIILHACNCDRCGFSQRFDGDQLVKIYNKRCLVLP